MAAPIIVAAAALGFTIASFWWQNARRGRLVAAVPINYRLDKSGTTVLMVRLPLAIYNAGARGLVVGDLRCWFPESSQVLALPWRGTYGSLRYSTEETVAVPSPFVVGGRQAVSVVIEFGGPWPGFDLTAGVHHVVVEVAVAVKSGKQRWRKLLDFNLNVLDRALETPAGVWPTTGTDPVTAERAVKSAKELLAELEARGRLRDQTPAETDRPEVDTGTDGRGSDDQ